MRALTASEIDRITGGLRKTMPARMRTMLEKPPSSSFGGGGIDWGNIQVSQIGWGADTNGSWAGTNSFNFFGPDPSAPSTNFFFNETDGIGKLSVVSPDLNNGVPYTINNFQGIPNGPYLEFGVQGNYTLPNGWKVEMQDGFFTTDPLNPHSTAAGVHFTVKF